VSGTNIVYLGLAYRGIDARAFSLQLSSPDGAKLSKWRRFFDQSWE